MKFAFHLAQAASSNTTTARAREQQRMGCLALGMSLLGHDVSIVSATDEFRRSARWAPFQKLWHPGATGISVHPAESTRNSNVIVDVGFKCSVGITRDAHLLSHCKVLIAHEYDMAFDADPRLLPVPFMVHDSVMDQFLEDGLFDAFIRNDIETIRRFYCLPKTGLLGMKACLHPWRRDFIADAPDWANLELYSVQTMPPAKHMPWVSQFRGGLSLSGTTPKSNLPPLLALLGVAIVAQPFRVRDTPRMDGTNSIQFESWEQVYSELSDANRVSEVVEAATECYVNSWSASGQARLLAERIS